MKRFILALAASLTLSGAAFAGDKEDRIEAAHSLLTTMGGAAMFDSMFDAMIDQIWASIEAQKPDADADAMKIFRAELTKAFKEQSSVFVDETVKIYTRHFTADQIRGIDAFYGTDAGAALLEKMPLVAADSMQMGTLLGQAVANKAVAKAQQRLKERGVEL